MLVLEIAGSAAIDAAAEPLISIAFDVFEGHVKNCETWLWE